MKELNAYDVVKIERRIKKFEEEKENLQKIISGEIEYNDEFGFGKPSNEYFLHEVDSINKKIENDQKLLEFVKLQSYFNPKPDVIIFAEVFKEKIESCVKQGYTSGTDLERIFEQLKNDDFFSSLFDK